MSIRIRPPQNPAEVRDIETVQQAAWGMDDRAITPYNTLHAWKHAGGIMLCAFDDDHMIGFSGSFPAEINGKRAQWSHMTGVIPQYQRQGIGRRLKFAQRETALQRGIDTIGWTFDPLRKKNALFNVEYLGATVRIMHEELYGEMYDDINRGLLSDRFEIHWALNADRVAARAEEQPREKAPQPDGYMLYSKNGEPTLNACQEAAHIGIALPADISAVRKQSLQAVHAWNYALREAIQPLFQAGYFIDRIYLPEEQPDVFVYVLSRRESWFLYVLETSDGSLYTGITTDVDKRLEAHNTGKGAKYTKSRRPVRLLAVWQTHGRDRATQAEHRFKKLSRSKKLAYIQSQDDFQHTKRRL